MLYNKFINRIFINKLQKLTCANVSFVTGKRFRMNCVGKIQTVAHKLTFIVYHCWPNTGNQLLPIGLSSQLTVTNIGARNPARSFPLGGRYDHLALHLPGAAPSTPYCGGVLFSNIFYLDKGSYQYRHNIV